MPHHFATADLHCSWIDGTGGESICAVVIRNDAPAERSDDGTGRVFGSFFCTLANRWSSAMPLTQVVDHLPAETNHLSSGLASGAALANPVRHPRNRLVPQLSTLRRGPAASLIENIWNLLPWTLTVCVGNCPRPLSSRCICSARPSVRD